MFNTIPYVPCAFSAPSRRLACQPSWKGWFSWRKRSSWQCPRCNCLESILFSSLLMAGPWSVLKLGSYGRGLEAPLSFFYSFSILRMMLTKESKVCLSTQPEGDSCGAESCEVDSLGAVSPIVSKTGLIFHLIACTIWKYLIVKSPD